jgi:hypothetical protein
MVGVALAGLASGPTPARAEVVWLCRPGLEADPCRGSQATTIRRAGRPARVVEPRLPARPPVDCFYVYPTVSGQPGTNADKAIDPELDAIARLQAGRFSQVCRVFAPVYRQLTLASILSGDPAARAAGVQLAYGDVLEAWREFLRIRSPRRGVVLLGHSQGSFLLRQLVKDRIDRRPRARRRLVSAILLGGNVAVRRGRTIGGDFRRIPGCTSPRQLRCVIAFSAFGGHPPPDARFGRPADGPGYEVLCTNPASLRANRRRPVTTLLRSEPFPGLLGAGLRLLYEGPPPTAATPWLQPADRYSVRCARMGGASVLLARPLRGARRLAASPDATWGLHLADMNLALGELVELVRGQGERYRRLSRARRR